MSQELVAIVMAAGKGTRMKSDLPKVLHPIAGEPLLGHVLLRVEGIGAQKTYVIVGHGGDKVREMLPGTSQAVEQKEQLGTGHAVDQVSPHLEGFQGTVVILSGDVPLLSDATLAALLKAHMDTKATLSLLTAHMHDPGSLGRVLRGPNGKVTGIVEFKDATADQRAIREINVGTYVCSWPHLSAALKNLTPNNAQGEYYLTDAIAAIAGGGHTVASHTSNDPWEGAGVNTRAELAALQTEYNRRTAAHWMAEGVTFTGPESTVVGPRVTLGRDCVVEQGAIILGRTSIGDRCIIGAYSQLRDMSVGDDVEILHSYLVDSSIGDGAHVGPYAHLRAHAAVGKNTRIGNFVEIKNSTLGDGTKAAHLAYLGDATIGKKVNIGCGVITVNYDGMRKCRTTVEDGAFVGSNSNLIAPVTVHADGYVAAGSTITEDVPAGALAVGRGRQANKEGWVAKRRGAQAATSSRDQG
ncbi:MAG: UDP-N-acetylglucosamine diphosphorylase/glucosamine-phosphate N-acetyltransferase [Cyanobacteria bacterium RYN_339]|nr:UDP-N-acetylglucosamine diphosphorylase/glucosamine-phosphate N-acetyltransferase [Cyanobacteria bacterium RYN_339]